MTTFDERAKGFEGKFAYDLYQQFRYHGRRNKLMGRWAAAQMGLTGAAADDYVDAVCRVGLAKSGDTALLDKISSDLTRCNAARPEVELAERMDRLLAQATRDVQNEPWPSTSAI
jgi:hypothetical protein